MTNSCRERKAASWASRSVGLLAGRIVGLFHTEADEAGQIIEDVARQEDFGPLAQRFVQVQQLESLVAQECFRFAYDFHDFSDSLRLFFLRSFIHDDSTNIRV